LASTPPKKCNIFVIPDLIGNPENNLLLPLLAAKAVQNCPARMKNMVFHSLVFSWAPAELSRYTSLSDILVTPGENKLTPPSFLLAGSTSLSKKPGLV
jgi:hypothetical protein